MTIFRNNLKRIFKSKINGIFMFILPIVLIVFTIMINGGTSRFSIGIVDNDNTKLTKMLIKQLNKESQVNHLKDYEIKKSLINLNNDYVIKIPKGFTKDLIEGQDVKIKGFTVNGTNRFMVPKFSTENFILVAKSIAKASKGDESLFYKAMNKYNQGMFEVKCKNIGDSSMNKKNVLHSLGFLAYNMLMLGVNITPIILKDKQTKVYYRIFAGPIKPKKYTLENLLSFLLVIAIQVFIIFMFMVLILNVKFPSLMNIILLFMIFSVFAVSFALFISNNSKNMRTVSTISSLTITPMAMLGGCFWPIDIMPKILQEISKFIPMTWVLKAADKLMYGGNLYSILPEIIIIILFSIVFLLLASWRKKDIMI